MMDHSGLHVVQRAHTLSEPDKPAAAGATQYMPRPHWRCALHTVLSTTKGLAAFATVDEVVGAVAEDVV